MRQLGPYVLEDEIARGGAGVVYRGRDAEGRAVAVKLLLGEMSEPRRRRFQREVEALTRLRHPHIVSIHDAGEDQGSCYLVMELVAGRSLQEVIDREGPLQEEEAARVTLSLAEAMQHAHEQNVLHRDLAPKNVVLDAAREPRLTDFGLTRDVESEGRSALSRTGMFMGTPGYWAPEQARGELAAIGPRSDVYGLGATLYCMLTGRPPHEGSSLVEILAAQSEPPPAPSVLRPGLERRLEAICMRCLRARPGDRFAGPGDLAQALRVYQAGGDPLALRRVAPWIVFAALGLGALAAGALALRAESAPAVDPTTEPDARVLSEEAEAHLLAGEWEDAIRKAGLVLGRDPQRTDAYLMRAEARLRQAGWRAREARSVALIDVERALKERPGEPRARALRLFLELEPALGEWLMYRGNDAAALRVEAESVLAADPKQGLAWLTLAVLLPNEERALALEHLDRAVASPRAERDARLRRVVRRGSAGGDSGESQEDIDAVLDLTANRPGLVRARAYAFVFKAFHARLREDLSAAGSDLEEALRLIPNDPVALFHRGDLRRDKGDFAGALADFLETTRSELGLPEFFVRVVQLRFDLGNPSPAELEECLTCLDRAEELRREGLGYVPLNEIEFLRARCTFRLGRTRLAKDLLRRVRVPAAYQEEAKQMLRSPD